MATKKKSVQTVNINNGVVDTPANPTIGFIEGDGIGADIMRACLRIWDSAIETAYKGERKIDWKEIYLGESAGKRFDGNFFPDESVEAIRELKVAIKGPLTTPIGHGFRSLNVALRQVLDLYACVRPVRYYSGVPSPLKDPEGIDVVIFRENTEDVYAGIEYASGTEKNNKLAKFLREEMGAGFFEDAGLGIKPISPFGSKRLIRKAIQFAIDHNRESVTLVHKGNIMKYTEGAFRNWGYELARDEFSEQIVTEEELYKVHKGKVPEGKIILKDRIADVIFQLLLLRPAEFDVIATMNLNGDYLSDAVAAEVGGIGIAPGANISNEIAVFEATHGTAPKYANQDKVNPSSLLLSGVMMLQFMGWTRAADLINAAYPKVIEDKFVTYDFARMMDNAHVVSTSTFADALIAKISGKAEDLERFEEERRETIRNERQAREHKRISDPIAAMRDSGKYPSTTAGIMSPIKSVHPKTLVSEAMRQMRQFGIRSIMVQPGDDARWGIMTQRDVVLKIIGVGRQPSKATVGEIANKELKSIHADATLREVALALKHYDVRRLVVEAKGVPVGIVSQTDLFNVIEEFGWMDD